MSELRTHFGPANPVGNSEIKLHNLTMPFDTHLTKYLVRFNTLAARIAWGDAALRFQFYDGLPDRLKDKIAFMGKPNTLCEMIEVTACHDALHWECQAERKMNRRYEQRNTFTRQTTTPQIRTTSDQNPLPISTSAAARPAVPRYQIDPKTRQPDRRLRLV